MKRKEITVKGTDALATQKRLEAFGYRVLSWTVIAGRQVVIVYA